ncbi:hypothetical protein Leryth_018406 [Lithospermum erythrorhizon]|nr:hypothetical protein Leryth_018406 [Lithospermum erythrorhizon]
MASFSYLYVPKYLSFFIHAIIIYMFIFSVYGNYNFNQDFDITWGDGRGKIADNGELLTLTLDNSSGSGFQSKKEYLFCKIDMKIKLVPRNSAGTVTAFFLSSEGPTHDEIDYEFLGNLSGEPYTVHTNVYTQGKGDREQQFHLWFDPRDDFHTYSILWNPQTIVFSIDEVPIREFKNLGQHGVQFPNNQPMKLYSSIWDADQWATRGGLIKTDWSQAPFTSSYKNFNASNDGCAVGLGNTSCESWMSQKLDPFGEEKLKWVKKNYMIYNYCTDINRFPQGLPPECNEEQQ